VQARREQHKLDREDRQLALLALAGEALDADDVAALGLVVQREEAVLVGVAVARVSHHLHRRALAAEVVEQQLAARRALAVDAA
jgi:hypothetical protein